MEECTEVALGAVALGAVALGAVAFGAVAFGAVAYMSHPSIMPSDAAAIQATRQSQVCPPCARTNMFLQAQHTQPKHSARTAQAQHRPPPAIGQYIYFGVPWLLGAISIPPNVPGGALACSWPTYTPNKECHRGLLFCLLTIFWLETN